ncbi:hypothetical protein ACIBG8_39225 [Nonomuraea sp. NPDC050556]|uniref:hypothetical protein n=1 Tax=Nonomuraea sp. NPDC050556 TaxID=3364369 RepID=UPI00379C2587
MLRTALGVTAAAVVLSGLAFTAPASAATTCRYTLSADKDIPVKSGPGKQYRTVGVVPEEREAPIFGTCVTKGTGPTHWIKVAQGKWKDAYVWRNYFDRM